MLAKITFLLLLVTLTAGEPTAPGIDRTVEGARSLGYQIIYGDEEMTMFNEVVNEMDKNVAKPKVRLNSAIKPLPAEDVKCLMSADHYCSKDMKETKNIIIHAVRDDCKECTSAQKEGAGKVIAAMMAHDHAAWKLFLTSELLIKFTPQPRKNEYVNLYDNASKIMKTALLIKPERKTLEKEKYRFKEVGEPEEVVGNVRFALPGVKVRARRYALEKVKV